MGVATFFVLTGSSFLVSAFRRVIPHAVRITTYVLIIATFVTIVDMLMEAVIPDVQKALGAFVYLIVVNCIILGRQEAFASKQPVGRSLLDAVGTGFGFIVALLMMGTVREVIGSGSVMGVDLFGSSYEPWVVMVLPPGGFFTIGFILLGFAWYSQRRMAKQKTRALPAGAARQQVA
jgi:electron transport complex protein RnfE